MNVCLYVYVGHRRGRRNEFATLQMRSTLTVKLSLAKEAEQIRKEIASAEI